MTDYISREAALKALYADYAYPAMGIIKEIPAADVAEVVRCKDCKYRRKNDENEPYCTAKDGLLHPSDDEFCSYGKRKEQTKE